MAENSVVHVLSKLWIQNRICVYVRTFVVALAVMVLLSTTVAIDYPLK